MLRFGILNEDIVAQSWGQDTFELSLPLGNIQFTGLSTLQLGILEADYAAFSALSGANPAGNIKCRAYKLSQPLCVTPEALTRDGLYTPRAIRTQDGAGVQLTGINFSAQIVGDGSSASSLGVALEEELPKPIVCENFLRVWMAHAALQQRGAILHSAGLVFDGKAYIFQGYSNAGKTTLTRKAYAGGARVLSDDINLLLPSDNGFRAHGVPFTGEFGRTLEHPGGRESFPVAGIILIEQGDELKTEQLTAPAAVARLLTGCPFVNTDEQASELLFDAVTAMVEALPIVRLFSRRDDPIEDIMQYVKCALTDTAESSKHCSTGTL